MTTKELLALVEKASELPWEAYSSEVWSVGNNREVAHRPDFNTTPNGYGQWPANAALIVAAVNALPALCAEVEAQAQRIAQQDATIARLRVSLALGGAALASDTGERGVVEITVGAGVHATDLWLREVGIGGSLVYVPLDTSSETVAALGAAINPRAALRAQPAGGGVELKLRRLLAMRVAGAMLYTDDGELSDGTEHPAIDFLRHSPEEIESLLRRRAELKAAIATLTPPESGGQGDGYAALHGFARELLSMLNDGGPDGGDVQRVAESHGLLTSTPTIVPCGEDCPCAEFYNHGDESDCYRRAPWLTADLSQGGGNHG